MSEPLSIQIAPPRVHPRQSATSAMHAPMLDLLIPVRCMDGWTDESECVECVITQYVTATSGHDKIFDLLPAWTQREGGAVRRNHKCECCGIPVGVGRGNIASWNNLLGYVTHLVPLWHRRVDNTINDDCRLAWTRRSEGPSYRRFILTLATWISRDAGAIQRWRRTPADSVPREAKHQMS